MVTTCFKLRLFFLGLLEDFIIIIKVIFFIVFSEYCLFTRKLLIAIYLPYIQYFYELSD